MTRGTVVGQVWGTRKSEGLDGHRLLLVALEGGGRLVVAVDCLDSRAGDRVLVAWGSGARNTLQWRQPGQQLLCDAAVCQVVDGWSDRPMGGA